MDSRTRLDYTLFQLTPTRTRCDLVLFSGGNSEKLASGLFQPFVSHLKFVKDEISKGGYSITLRPVANASSWFTKGTLQRFVCFVSTPEVLERFVSLEKEISQIDDSVQANELSLHLTEGRLSAAKGSTKKSTDFPKPRDEVEQKTDMIEEESSKFRLKLLLESRKALLRKEQAMAYARALVVGFELNIIDELISFADAFGASRLREACINFKDLCKKKHSDVLWMDEVAAMKACTPSDLSFLGTSGIVLTNKITGPGPNPNGSLSASISDSTTNHASLEINEDNNSSVPDQTTTTDEVQVQMPWPTQIPHYVYNLQNPMQQGPPYQGYLFPPKQYHHMNMQWHASMDESVHGQMQPDYHRKLYSGKKEKFSKQRKPEYSEEDINSESGDSEAGSDSESYVKESPSRKTHRKKSSKTVVIRNINYITSKKGNGVSDGSWVEDELFDGNSLDQVDDAVGSFEKHHKSSARKHKKKGGYTNGSITTGSDGHERDTNIASDRSDVEERQENWDTFQNLLMINEENRVEKKQTMDVHDDQFTIRSTTNESSLVPNHAITLESEEVSGQRIVAADSFIVSGTELGMESRTKSEHFENGEDFHLRMKSANEEILCSQRMDNSNIIYRTKSDYVTESSVIKNRKGEDWFIVNQYDKSKNHGIVNEKAFFDGHNIIENHHSSIEKCVKESFGDDSFMVQLTSASDDHYASQWKTDIVADLSLVGQSENSSVDKAQENPRLCNKHEPDDLFMVLERNYRLESPDPSQNMDYRIDMSVTETDRRSSVDTENRVNDKLPLNNKSPKNKIAISKTKEQGKEVSHTLRGSLGKSRSGVMSTTKKPSSITRPAVQKSKLEKEEEIRIKKEELLLERQRRIAERTATRGVTPASSKKVLLESKTVKASIKDDKSKTKAKARETKN